MAFSPSLICWRLFLFLFDCRDLLPSSWKPWISATPHSQVIWSSARIFQPEWRAANSDTRNAVEEKSLRQEPIASRRINRSPATFVNEFGPLENFRDSFIIFYNFFNFFKDVIVQREGGGGGGSRVILFYFIQFFFVIVVVVEVECDIRSRNNVTRVCFPLPLPFERNTGVFSPCFDSNPSWKLIRQDQQQNKTRRLVNSTCRWSEY